MKPSELLARPESWCQKAFAIDKNGTFVAPDSSMGVKWCMVGAVMRCFDSLAECDIHEKTLATAGFGVEWNDAPGRTHAEVLAALTSVGL